MWVFYLAHELHKFESEILEMPADEFDRWLKYFQQKNKEEAKAHKKALKGHKK